MILTAMIVIWCIGLALHAWAPSANELWYGRALMGAGQSGVYAALSRVTRDWFPAVSRTTVQGWVGVFFGRIGGVSCNLLIGTVLLGFFHVPWRTVVLGLTAVGLAHAALFATLYRNNPARHPLVNDAEARLIAGGQSPASASSSTRLPLKALFRRATPRSLGNLMALNVQMVLSNIADNIFLSWLPLFLASVHGLGFQEMGFYSALPLLGGALGGASGGWLNDWLIRRTGNLRRVRSGVGAAGKGIACVLLLVALLWYDNPAVFCGILVFVKFFADWGLTTTWGTVTDIGGRATATVFAFTNAVGTAGAVIAPTLYGAIAEHYDWKHVFLTGAGAYLLCSLAWLAVDSSIPVIRETDDSAAAL